MEKLSLITLGKQKTELIALGKELFSNNYGHSSKQRIKTFNNHPFSLPFLDQKSSIRMIGEDGASNANVGVLKNWLKDNKYSIKNLRVIFAKAGYEDKDRYFIYFEANSWDNIICSVGTNFSGGKIDAQAALAMFYAIAEEKNITISEVTVNYSTYLRGQEIINKHYSL